MQVNVLTRVCGSCGEDKPQQDWLPSHWRGHGRKCGSCFRARNLELARARGVQPKAPRDPEAKQRAQEAFYVRNPRYKHAQVLKRYYGMTLDEYDLLFDLQDGVCAGCQQPETRTTPSGGVALLCVDHDHDTGRVRGLLCARCNFSVGYAQDNPATLRALADYLEASCA